MQEVKPSHEAGGAPESGDRQPHALAFLEGNAPGRGAMGQRALGQRAEAGLQLGPSSLDQLILLRLPRHRELKPSVGISGQWDCKDPWEVRGYRSLSSQISQVQNALGEGT